MFKSVGFKQITERKLRWEDFKGDPLFSETKSADLLWQIFYYRDTVSNSNHSFNPGIKVWYAFDENSWVLPQFKSDILLNHEQGHFDIVKIYADSMKILIPTLAPFSESNWKRRVDSLKNNIVSRCRKMQNYYDIETGYAKNTEKQVIWDSLIKYKIISYK